MLAEASAARETIDFVARHGYAVLFFWILAEQGAIPLPSVPLLIVTGALLRTGKLHLLPVLLACISAALIADLVWFHLGRRLGTSVLRVLCRISLEPDSCVRRTGDAFLRYGLRPLLVSKFIPGLNAVAAPMAGNSGVGIPRFLVFDCAGTLLWITSYIGIGYIFGEQLEMAIAYASRMGSWLFLLAAGALAAWLSWKYIQRRKFLRQLDIARISVEELRDRLDAGEKIFIVDVRGGRHTEPTPIPGATRISSEELAARYEDIPRDREIILFCD
jgi:membrane protein DedA with SNARE-associated domain